MLRATFDRPDLATFIRERGNVLSIAVQDSLEG
jgi:hypothetical protein